MKKIWKRAGIALGILIVLAVGGFLWASNMARQQAASLAYEDVDMARVADGVYWGEADAKLVFARVRVSVKNHALTDVQIEEHRNGMGSAAEAVAPVMVGENRWDVDAVSGATLSSEVIKSAVSKALMQGVQ